MTRDGHLLNHFTAIPNIFQRSPLLLSEEVRDSLGKKGMLCDQSETENAYILVYKLNSMILFNRDFQCGLFSKVYYLLNEIHCIMQCLPMQNLPPQSYSMIGCQGIAVWLLQCSGWLVL